MYTDGASFSEYNWILVVISFIVAASASYCALELVAHLNVATTARRVWLIGGAAIFGLGVWAMHFIGMLAFQLPVPIAYHLPTVALSMVPAIGAAALALHIATASQLTTGRLIGGAVLMGAGIGGMHYGGMFAMRMHASTSYDLRFVLFSVVFAVAAALFALHAAFSLRDEQTEGYERVIGGVILGAAIAGLHYSAMIWASHFTPHTDGAPLTDTALVATIPPSGAVLLAIVALGTIGIVLGRVRKAVGAAGLVQVAGGD